MSIPQELIAAAAAASRPLPSSYWVVPHKLLAGQYPCGFNEPDVETRLRAYVEGGVSVFVNLTEADERLGWEELAHYDHLLARLDGSSGAIAHHRFPIPDGGTTSVDQMRRTLDEIDSNLDAGRTVYVHCLGGHGRTGTTVGCWLLRHHHVTRAGVLGTVQALHDVMPRSWPSPETPAQWQFVLDWPEGG